MAISSKPTSGPEQLSESQRLRLGGARYGPPGARTVLPPASMEEGDAMSAWRWRKSFGTTPAFDRKSRWKKWPVLGYDYWTLAKSALRDLRSLSPVLILHTHLNNCEETLLAQSKIPGVAGHNLHKGTPREVFIREFLSEQLPFDLGIGSGEVIDCTTEAGGKRNQNDIIVYRTSYPRISLGGGINAFLRESVVATIEVKSVLTEEELEEAISLEALEDFSAWAREGFPGATLEQLLKIANEREPEYRVREIRVRAERPVHRLLGLRGRR